MDTEVSKEKKNYKEAMEEDCTLVIEALQQIVGSEHIQNRPGPLQAVLTKGHNESGKDGENS